MNETTSSSDILDVLETTVETVVSSTSASDELLVLSNIEILLQGILGILFVLLLIVLLRYIYRFFDIFF